MQQRLLTTALIALLAASAAAAAVAAERDTARIRIVSGGSEEAVDVALDEMKVGESRQLVSASGKPAIVTRTDSGLTIDIAGKRTEVAFPDVDEITVHGDGKVRVVRLDGEHAAHHGDGSHERKVIVMRHHGTADGEIDEAAVDALVAEIESSHGLDHHDGDADGDKVIVTRKVVRERVD